MARIDAKARLGLPIGSQKLSAMNKTARMMPDRNLGNGEPQAVQAEEEVVIRSGSQALIPCYDYRKLLLNCLITIIRNI